jgi:branched-chain amino acid transport system ATP-binding protein
LSVKENLIMAARAGSRHQAWSLEEIYQEFPIFKDRAGLKGTSLSGGEQQMLAIARSLMTNPDLLLMDEPSEGLAPLIVRQVGDIILRLKERGISILLVEQNYPLALRVTDFLYIISKGRIVFEGTSQELEANQEIKIKHLSATR